MRIIDIDSLRQIHDEYVGGSSRVESASIQLDSEAVYVQRGSFGRSLVASIKGTELKRLYDEHRESLFDRNVRLFLGTRKGSVNAGIRDTLQDKDERKNFWAYNNGITLVCDGFDYNESTGILSVRGFSIVNGCQTTVSISSIHDAEAEEMEVLARFIASPEPRIVDSIIRYNNSQTNIRDWDLVSQNRNQKRLKRLLVEDDRPFFYELRKGEWGNLTQEDKMRFARRGKPQVIAPDVLAQRLAAFKGMPVAAYKDKSALFTAHGQLVFPPDLRIEEVLVAWHTGETVEEVIAEAVKDTKALIEKQSKEGLASEGEREQIKILTRGGKTFVVSIVALLLLERNGLEYLGRIKSEVAGSYTTRDRLKVYAEVALTYYLEIMEDAIEVGRSTGMDLNQIVRSEDAFQRTRRRIRTKWDRDKRSETFIEALPKIN